MNPVEAAFGLLSTRLSSYDWTVWYTPNGIWYIKAEVVRNNKRFQAQMGIEERRLISDDWQPSEQFLRYAIELVLGLETKIGEYFREGVKNGSTKMGSWERPSD